jgi:hypothetical protein
VHFFVWMLCDIISDNALRSSWNLKKHITIGSTKSFACFASLLTQFCLLDLYIIFRDSDIQGEEVVPEKLWNNLIFGWHELKDPSSDSVGYGWICASNLVVPPWGLKRRWDGFHVGYKTFVPENSKGEEITFRLIYVTGS